MSNQPARTRRKKNTANNISTPAVPAPAVPAPDPGAEQAAQRTLTVRMYDVGFGDCFLLKIPQEKGRDIKVLFDCGSIKQGPRGTPIREIVKQVIRDVRDDPAQPPRIDVVVATHRHKDHIIGFDDPAWSEVEVGEVWMPWTEKPEDQQAREIREMHYRLADQLSRRLTTFTQPTAAQPVDADKLMMYQAALEMAMNALSNDGAMRTLYKGFAGDPERCYFPDEKAVTTWFTTPRLPGVTIHVLGPSRDTDVITQLNPPAGQSYLSMMEAEVDGSPEPPLPFGEDWVVQPPDYQSNYPGLAAKLTDEDCKVVQSASLGLDAAVAAVLDQALNGTSLMLVFQIGTATLLFPGDAQWGTWRLALENPEFRKLLTAATFYKVGHHGSHNATPVEFVEKVMGNDVWAMVSVNPTGNWKFVPKEDLLKNLIARGCKLIRSDLQEDAAALGFSVMPDCAIDVKIPF